jgi:hypothetical protein
LRGWKNSSSILSLNNLFIYSIWIFYKLQIILYLFPTLTIVDIILYSLPECLYFFVLASNIKRYRSILVVYTRLFMLFPILPLSQTIMNICYFSCPLIPSLFTLLYYFRVLFDISLCINIMFLFPALILASFLLITSLTYSFSAVFIICSMAHDTLGILIRPYPLLSR